MSFTLSTAGCIPAEELQFVMNHLPGKVGHSGEIIVEYVQVYARYPPQRYTP